VPSQCRDTAKPVPGLIEFLLSQVLAWRCLGTGYRGTCQSKGRRAIVKEYDPETDSLSRIEAAFAKCGGLEREPTATEQKLIRTLSRRK